jgi:hypothetical protein
MISRAIAVAVTASSVACVVFASWVLTLPGDVVIPENVPSLVIQLGLGVLSWVISGALVVWLRPHNVVGWLLLFMGASEAWQIGLAAYGGYGAVAADPP